VKPNFQLIGINMQLSAKSHQSALKSILSKYIIFITSTFNKFALSVI